MVESAGRAAIAAPMLELVAHDPLGPTTKAEEGIDAGRVQVKDGSTEVVELVGEVVGIDLVEADDTEKDEADREGRLELDVASSETELVDQEVLAEVDVKMLDVEEETALDETEFVATMLAFTIACNTVASTQLAIVVVYPENACAKT